MMIDTQTGHEAPFTEVERARAEALIEEHRGFVVSVAARIHAAFPFVQMEELIAEGNMGVMKASRMWKPELGAKFTSYCHQWLRRFMYRLVSLRRAPFRITSVEKLNRMQFQYLDHPAPGTGSEEVLGSWFILPDEPETGANADEADAIRALVDGLPKREGFIIREHFFNRRDIRALAPEMGLSRQRVDQIKSKALARLRVRAARLKP